MLIDTSETSNMKKRKMRKLSAYKKAKYAHVIQNTNIRTKCTHMVFATDNNVQYDELVSNPLHKHINFTDRKGIPGTKLLKDTLKLLQVHGSNSVVEHGDPCLTTAFYRAVVNLVVVTHYLLKIV